MYSDAVAVISTHSACNAQSCWAYFLTGFVCLVCCNRSLLRLGRHRPALPPTPRSPRHPSFMALPSPQPPPQRQPRAPLRHLPSQRLPRPTPAPAPYPRRLPLQLPRTFPRQCPLTRSTPLGLLRLRPQTARPLPLPLQQLGRRLQLLPHPCTCQPWQLVQTLPVRQRLSIPSTHLTCQPPTQRPRLLPAHLSHPLKTQRHGLPPLPRPPQHTCRYRPCPRPRLLQQRSIHSTPLARQRSRSTPPPAALPPPLPPPPLPLLMHRHPQQQHPRQQQQQEQHRHHTAPSPLARPLPPSLRPRPQPPPTPIRDPPQRLRLPAVPGAQDQRVALPHPPLTTGVGSKMPRSLSPLWATALGSRRRSHSPLQETASLAKARPMPLPVALVVMRSHSTHLVTAAPAAPLFCSHRLAAALGVQRRFTSPHQEATASPAAQVHDPLLVALGATHLRTSTLVPGTATARMPRQSRLRTALAVMPFPPWALLRA